MIPTLADLDAAALKLMTTAAAVLLIWFVAFAGVLISRSRAEAYEAAPEPLQRPERPVDPRQWEEESETERARR
jgi:hypothetical protein